MHNVLTNIPIWAYLLQQSKFDGQDVVTPEYIVERLKLVDTSAPFEEKVVLILKVPDVNSSDGYRYQGVFLDKNNQENDFKFDLNDILSFENFYKALPQSYIFTNVINLPEVELFHDKFYFSDKQASQVIQAMEGRWPHSEH